MKVLPRTVAVPALSRPPPLPAEVVDPGAPSFEDAVRRFAPDALGGLPPPQPPGNRVFYYAPGHFVPVLAAENPVRCSGVVLARAAHEAVGGFDPSYRYAVDWDFWLRVARRYTVAWILRPPGVAFRWHPASETHRFRTGTTDLDEQIRLLDRLNPPGTDRRPIDRRLARAFLNRAHVALKGGDVVLARTCLDRAFGLSREVLMTIALDPRLAAQMTALRLAPEWAGRWFARPAPASSE